MARSSSSGSRYLSENGRTLAATKQQVDDLAARMEWLTHVTEELRTAIADLRVGVGALETSHKVWGMAMSIAASMATAILFKLFLK